MKEQQREHSIQEFLKCGYECAQARMECHPELAEKYMKIIQQATHYTSIEEVKQVVANIIKKRGSSVSLRVFAKIAKDKNHYFIQHDFVVNDARENPEILKAAEYIGLGMIYWDADGWYSGLVSSL